MKRPFTECDATEAGLIVRRPNNKVRFILLGSRHKRSTLEKVDGEGSDSGCRGSSNHLMHVMCRGLEKEKDDASRTVGCDRQCNWFAKLVRQRCRSSGCDGRRGSRARLSRLTTLRYWRNHGGSVAHGSTRRFSLRRCPAHSPHARSGVRHEAEGGFGKWQQYNETAPGGRRG